MLGKELLSYVDHTLLRPTATWDDIKEKADYVTKTNEEDGVAYAIEKFCGIER